MTVSLSKSGDVEPTTTPIPWTLFWDMHSGGGSKENADKIYIQAPEEEAKVVFYNRFGHSPERVSCTCCGDDYSISESATLEEASAYHRNCESGYRFVDTGEEVEVEWRDLTWNQDLRAHFYQERQVENVYFERRRTDSDSYCSSMGELKAHIKRTPYVPIEEYVNQGDVLVIPDSDIKPEERRGTVPQQGYIYVG